MMYKRLVYVDNNIVEGIWTMPDHIHIELMHTIHDHPILHDQLLDKTKVAQIRDRRNFCEWMKNIWKYSPHNGRPL